MTAPLYRTLDVANKLAEAISAHLGVSDVLPSKIAESEITSAVDDKPWWKFW